MEFKYPTSKEEMEELRKSLRREIAEDDLELVSGGNDDVKGKSQPYDWVCPGCGMIVRVKQEHDKAKHCVHECTANPWK